MIPIGHFTSLLVLAIVIVTIQGCGSKKVEQPTEYYNDLSVVPETSQLVIPFKIHRPDFEQSINQYLDSILYADYDMADDGLQMVAKKAGPIRIDFSNDTIFYTVPVNIWIRRDLGITSATGEGSIELEFKSDWAISYDWQLTTHTELKSYRWLRRPVLKTALFDIPITPIVNYFLDRSRTDIAAAIDEEVKNMFDLRKEMEYAWQQLHQPFLLSEEYMAWLLLNPLSISMPPIEQRGDTLLSAIQVECRPTIQVGSTPFPPAPTPLPYLQRSIFEENLFKMQIVATIPFSEARRISKATMLGETYTYGRKKVTIEDIDIYGRGNQLVVKTTLSGSYKGDVYFTGRPAFNARKNAVELESVDFDFSTKKALLRTASWLFKGRLRQSVEESLNYYLNYNLEDTANYIRESIENYPVAPGITLHGDLDELSVSHVYISPDGIHVRISLVGKVALDVRGIGL